MDVALGALMGLAYVVPPGPVNIETVRRGLVGGFGTALAIQLGALVGDLAYALLALVGAGLLVAHSVTHTLLSMAGSGLLLYLGGRTLAEGWHGRMRPAACTARTRPAACTAGAGLAPARAAVLSGRRSFVTGAALSLANPCTVGFWLSLGGAVLPPEHHSPLLVLGSFFLSTLLWGLALPLLVCGCRAWLGTRFFQWVSIACGLGLIACGLALGQTAVLHG